MPNTLENEIENALDILAREAASDFRATMKTWENHATPVETIKSKYRRIVLVDDDIYRFLNFRRENERWRYRKQTGGETGSRCEPPVRLQGH